MDIFHFVNRTTDEKNALREKDMEDNMYNVWNSSIDGSKDLTVTEVCKCSSSGRALF